MATIALSGTSLNYTMGIGAFQGLGKAFSDAKMTSGGLRDALNTLKSKIDIASVAAKVDTVQEQVQKAQARESEKASSLTLAYEKLDTLICDTGTIDYQVYNKISSREDDFYKCYYYLKPECKKTGREKASDWWADRWQDFKNFWGGVGFLLKNFAKGLADWCKEVFSNVISAVTAIFIIVAAIAICIFCAPEIIMAIAIIVCAVSAAYGLVDIGVMLFNDGKDIPALLEEKGHKNLAAFIRGCDFGLTVASFILPIGAGIKTIMLVGEKTFLNATKEWFKTSIKGLWNSLKNIGPSLKNIFTCSGKPGFKGVVQSVGMSLWKGFKCFTGLDDIARLKDLRSFTGHKSGWVIRYDSNDWAFDRANMQLTPKSQKALDTLQMANQSFKNAGSSKIIDSIPLTKNNGFVDVNWDDISLVTLEKGKDFNLKNLNMNQDLRDQIYGNKSSRVNISLNNGLSSNDPNFISYTYNSKKEKGLYTGWGFTAHENFSLKENIVPSAVHNSITGEKVARIGHFGGIGRINFLFNSTSINNDTILRGLRNIFVGTEKEFTAMTIGGN
ncbi:MAG: hypothetical protein HDT42_03150 [Ruminococcaceae bacterium]|nr:hypothetical protein [Oscillospiraceae bacterium]